MQPTLFAVLVTIVLPVGAQTSREPERIEIIETRPTVFLFGSNAVAQIVTEDQYHPRANIAETVTAVPGVVENGQNGLYQTLSVRGVSGQRVQSRFAGIPLSTERRAGTAASFIDPAFLRQINVIKGPASTVFGSGALGGVIYSEQRAISGFALDLSQETSTGQSGQFVGLGNERASIALANRSAPDGEDSNGMPLNTGFEQSSLMTQIDGSVAGIDLSGVLLLSDASDIGRSNNLYPDQRIVNVDDEEHALFGLQFESSGRFAGRVYLHDYSSSSETIDLPDRVISGQSDSKDWGAHLNRNWRMDAWFGAIGIEFDNRDGVKGDQMESTLGTNPTPVQQNLDAASRSTSIFATATTDIQNHAIEIGLRQNWLEYKQSQLPRRRYDQLSGHLGWQWHFATSWAISAELSRAYRAPSLSELFYSGVTGRGNVIGNPDLKEETAIAADIGLHYRYGPTQWSAHLFQQDFDNYIERIAVTTLERSFQNTTDGRIRGLEFGGEFILSDAWSMEAGFHLMEGEDSTGRTLPDIPAQELFLAAEYLGDDWTAGISWKERFSKNDIAETELPIDSASIIELYANLELRSGLNLSVYAKNALDQAYQISADEISTLANRSLAGIRVRYELP